MDFGGKEGAASLPEPEVHDLGDGTICLRRICTITSAPFTVAVQRSAYEEWTGGKLIHQVPGLAHLDLEQREFLLSGLTPAEFDALFEGEDDL